MNFRRILLIGGLAAFFIAPSVVFGAGLVPECNGPYCQACDLVQLINNVISFAVYLSVFVATIMFVYAGFLYVTAAARTENLQKARSVFTSVFVGLVLVLTAWLIVDLILTVLTPHKDGFGFWVNIECVDLPTFEDASPTTVGVGSRNGGLPYDDGAENNARLRLESGGIVVNNNPCTTPTASGCTNVGGLNDSVINSLVAIENQCSTCEVVVTGGTEQGPHRGHTGSQVDIRKDPATVDFLSDKDVQQDLGISKVVDEGDHLHIEFGP